MNRKIFLSLLVVAFFTGLSPQVQAARPVLDQSAPVAEPIPFTFALGGPGSMQVLYQSFRVGITGRLAELRFPIGCHSGEVIVEIFDADATTGLPVAGASPRLRRSFLADMFPEIVMAEFQPLPLGGRVGVTAGEEIVVVLSNPTGSCGIAAGIVGDGYLNGTGHADDTTDIFPPVPLSLSGDRRDLPFQSLIRVTGGP